MKKLIHIILILLLCAILVGFFKPVRAAEPCALSIEAPEGELNLTVGSPRSAAESVVANLGKRNLAYADVELYSNNEKYLNEAIALLELNGYECRSIHDSFAYRADVWYGLDKNDTPDYVQLIISR